MTAETVLQPLKDCILLPFETPRATVGDNRTCFTAEALQDYVENEEPRWKNVLGCVPMSNRKAERMVGTIKRGSRQMM